jgi:hypothetical protein
MAHGLRVAVKRAAKLSVRNAHILHRLVPMARAKPNHEFAERQIGVCGFAKVTHDQQAKRYAHANNDRPLHGNPKK